MENDQKKQTQTREKLEKQYDKYAAQFQELLASSQTKGREAMDAAIAASRENMVALGEITTEQGKLFGEYLKRDLAQTSKDMQHLGDEAREHLHPSRIGAGALSAVSRAVVFQQAVFQEPEGAARDGELSPVCRACRDLQGIFPLSVLRRADVDRGS